MEILVQLSQLPIFEKIDGLKAEISKLLPLPKDLEGKIMQKFRLDWNFNSNAIEGNTLNYGETVAFLMHGITAKGKPFKDYLDIKGHNESIDYLLDIIRKKDELTEKDIRSIHKLLLGDPYTVKAQTESGFPTTKVITPGQYKTTPNHVETSTGQIHYYVNPEDTPIRMQELMDSYRSNKENPEIHPIVLAAYFHHQFVAIHPFDDGNGRMTRLLMNLIIMQEHYPPVVVKNDERNEYYLALSQADTGEYETFVDFIATKTIASLELYLKGARGESLEEPTDLDKEIALFKKEIESRKDKVEYKRNLQNQSDLYEKSITPLIEETRNILGKFSDLFMSYEESIIQLNSKWEYNTAPELGFDNIEDYIKSEFNKNDSFDIMTINFLLSEFKVENYLFGLESKIVIQLSDYKYEIYFIISEDYELLNYNNSQIRINLYEPLFSNYYHQNISADEILRLLQIEGKKIFQLIQDRYKNPEKYVVDIDTQTLSTKWIEFLEISIHDNIKNDYTKIPNFEIVNSKKLLCDANEMSVNESKFFDVLREFSDYLHYNLKLPFRLAVDSYNYIDTSDNLPF